MSLTKGPDTCAVAGWRGRPVPHSQHARGGLGPTPRDPVSVLLNSFMPQPQQGQECPLTGKRSDGWAPRAPASGSTFTTN